jgi:hypothetical protein
VPPPATPTGPPKHQRWPSPGWLLAGLALVAILLAMVLVAPRLLYPPLTDRELDRQRVTVGKDRIELKREQDKLQNDARGALLQGLGGAVLLLGAYFTWRQVQTSREQLQQTAQATQEQLELAREGQLTERFTRAVDQLGSEHLDVRLGGIYTLERIARNSPPDRVTIEEVLTAYVRGHAPLPSSLAIPTPEPTTQPTDTAAHQPLPAGWATAGSDPATQPATTRPKRPRPAADVQAAVTVLGRRQLPPDRLRHLNLTRVDLRGAFLGGGPTSRARSSAAPTPTSRARERTRIRAGRQAGHGSRLKAAGWSGSRLSNRRWCRPPAEVASSAVDETGCSVRPVWTRLDETTSGSRSRTPLALRSSPRPMPMA